MPTPAELGFVMPAEWEPHARCWMAWPCRRATWGDAMDAARDAYAAVARAIAAFEPVTMLCNPADVAEASLACGRGIDVLPMETDDSWTRDIGPTFLVDRRGGLAGVDWRFNGYGEKFRPYDRDADLARRLLERTGAGRFAAPIVLEGGAIHSDGEGTLLVTETAILNRNRNPGLDRRDAERVLCDHLGAARVIWLPGGLEDDETDGHVDNVACFVRPGVVLALTTDDPSDGNHAVLHENLAVLRGAVDAAERPLQVLTVAQPPRRERQGRRLALSYVNLYVANGGVVMPEFEAATDDKAYRVVRDAFRDRRVVRVPALDIVAGGGGIHCVTQQQPAV